MASCSDLVLPDRHQERRKGWRSAAAFAAVLAAVLVALRRRNQHLAGRGGTLVAGVLAAAAAAVAGYLRLGNASPSRALSDRQRGERAPAESAAGQAAAPANQVAGDAAEEGPPSPSATAEGKGAGKDAPRRAVRRGAVRAKQKEEVVASSWEHVEVVMDADADALNSVSSLVLMPGGAFRAQQSSRAGLGDGARGPDAVAVGSWRPCRGGVDLVFEPVRALRLPERIVTYSLRNNCLVADEAGLPDGLLQEYSRCASDTAAGGSGRQAGGPMMARLLADDRSKIGTLPPLEALPPTMTSQAGTQLPVGVIEEGADSEKGGWAPAAGEPDPFAEDPHLPYAFRGRGPLPMGIIEEGVDDAEGGWAPAPGEADPFAEDDDNGKQGEGKDDEEEYSDDFEDEDEDDEEH